MLKFRTLGVAAVIAIAAPASAGTVFSQDFSGGLGTNESVGGLFSVNGGTVGHSGFYSDNEYSYYDLSLNLAGYSGVTLSFDYNASIEGHYDRFNVLASTGAFAPPAGLISAVSGLAYTDEGHDHRPELGQIALANSAAGTALFDLSAFDGQAVNLRFQFGSDGSVTYGGVNLDNIVISGVGGVPEPAAWALMIGGFGVVGGAMRRRKPVAAIA